MTGRICLKMRGLLRSRGVISEITIRTLRSINTEISCDYITTFVGPNDAGKSNVLRALNLFFNDRTNPLDEFDFNRDFNNKAKTIARKADQIEISIKFRLPDGYVREGFSEEVVWKKYWRKEGNVSRLEKRCYANGIDFPPRSKIPALLDRILYTYIPAIKDPAFFADLQGRIYDVLATVAERPLKDSAEEFENQLQDQLHELLGSIDFSRTSRSQMKLPENLREIFESLEFNSDGIPLSRRGDGIKIRHIPEMLKFIASKRDELLTRGGVRHTHIWGFEEPENNVEMSSAFDMAKEIVEHISDHDHIQIFLTTHSPIFYRLDQQKVEDEDWIKTHFVERDKNGSKITTKNPDEVDATMGLMPLVAPHVHAAKQQYEQLQADLKLARELLQKRVRTVLVEGATDRRIISLAWSIFSGGGNQNIHFDDGGDNYGSANALASRSLAWIVETRHMAAKDRVRAIAIFDRDEAGLIAKNKLNENLSNLSITRSPEFKIYVHEPHASLIEIKKAGFKIPIDLEALYSDELWTIAKRKNYLEPEENFVSLLTQNQIQQWLTKDINPFLELPDLQQLRIRHNFSKEGKDKMVRFIEKMNIEDQRIQLANFKDIVLMIETVLFT